MIIKGTIIDTHLDGEQPYFSLQRGSDRFRCHVGKPLHGIVKSIQLTGQPIELEARISQADFWVDEISDAI